jgi:hypothetical protein
VRAFREMTGSTSGGFEGAIMSVGSCDSYTGGVSTSVLKYPPRWPSKYFVPYTCVSENIFHHNYNKGL